MELKTLPITIDPQAIAAGLRELATDDELVAMRFGLLPAHMMNAMQRSLEEKFRGMASSPECAAGDKLWAVLKEPHERWREFSMAKLVSEAMHEITLAIYSQSEMVV